MAAKDGDKKPAAAKFTGECNYCHKKNHKEADCWAKKRDLAQVAMVHTTINGAECAFNAVASMPASLNGINTANIGGDIEDENSNNNNFEITWNQRS